MNSGLLKIVAVVLTLAALGTAWLGYRLSTRPVVQVNTSPKLYAQLVATRDIEAGESLQAADITLQKVERPEVHRFERASEVVGKVAVLPIKSGTVFSPNNFLNLSELAQALGPGERALAVKVSEVTGVGGFLRPGDHVDVLLYLRADRETANVSMARLLLADVRVLAYGDEVSAQAGNVAETAADPTKTGMDSILDNPVKKYDAIKGKAGKSAVLAVPSAQAAALMLAENTGILRLALRKPASISAVSAETQPIRLEELAGNGKAGLPMKAAPEALPVVRQRAAVKGVEPKRGHEVMLYRGDQVEIVNVK